METNREILSKHDLHELVRERPGPVISIFIPTERTGSEVQQNRIRLKNALAQAAELCEQRGLNKRDYAKLLEPAHELLDDSPFWQHQSLGLAVFAAPGYFQTFRLPLRFDKRVYVGARFYTKPLLPLLSVDGHFYILAASYGGMRLLLGTRQEVHALELDGNLAQSVDEFRVHGRQSNVQMRGAAGAGDAAGSVSHGHDKKALNERMSQVAYLREWAHAIDKLLGGDNAPLVLVGDEPLLGLLQPMLEYPHVHGDTIDRNPEQLPESKLHELAWPMVEPRFATLKRMASELIERQRSKDGKGVVDTIADVVRAAASGSVEVMFVRKGYSVQGIFDPASGEFSEAWDDDPQASEMANLAASLAIEYGGIVYVVSEDEMPGQVPVVAALRY